MTTIPAPPTPSRGLPATPPQGRRRDHLLVCAESLALVALVLVGARGAFVNVMTGDHTEAVITMAVIGTACLLAQISFARRSSLGGLVGGVAALATSLPQLMATSPRQLPEWWLTTISVDHSLYVGALLLGGSLGMRQARRAGRAEARTARQLAAQDRQMGQQPAAPPSRRRSHLLSGVLTLAAAGAVVMLLRQDGPLATGYGYVLACALILLLAAAGTARSTLGARVTGTVLILAGLPSLLWGSLLPSGPAAPLLPQDPTGTTLVLMGILLSTLGWGAHAARRQGRTAQAAALHARET